MRQFQCEDSFLPTNSTQSKDDPTALQEHITCLTRRRVLDAWCGCRFNLSGPDAPPSRHLTTTALME